MTENQDSGTLIADLRKLLQEVKAILDDDCVKTLYHFYPNNITSIKLASMFSRCSNVDGKSSSELQELTYRLKEGIAQVKKRSDEWEKTYGRASHAREPSSRHSPGGHKEFVNRDMEHLTRSSMLYERRASIESSDTPLSKTPMPLSPKEEEDFGDQSGLVSFFNSGSRLSPTSQGPSREV